MGAAQARTTLRLGQDIETPGSGSGSGWGSGSDLTKDELAVKKHELDQLFHVTMDKLDAMNDELHATKDELHVTKDKLHATKDELDWDIQELIDLMDQCRIPHAERP